MKKLLLALMVFTLGACSTVDEPVVDEPNKYYKEMGLMEENDFERYLKGRWITSGRTIEDDHYIISEYTLTTEKGKRLKTIDISKGVTNSTTEFSYEIKFDDANPDQALLVMYTIDEGDADIPWDKFPLYIEIQKLVALDFDVYGEYMRYYDSAESIKTGPTALKRGNSLGGSDRI